MPELVGQPIDRIDGRLKVTGRATYAYEHKIPNALRAVIVTSTVAKGKIASIDAKAAEGSQGVVAVMTHLNAPKLPQLQSQPKAPPTGRLVQVLQDDVVRYANQPVALVVADSFENAVEAAQLVRIRYASQRPEVELESRLSSAYMPQKVGGAGDPAASKRGDMQAGLSQAELKLDQVYRTPFEVHNPMEPHATIAVWDGPDHLTLYDATQGVFSCRGRVASLFGLKPENVHVLSPYLGGGFGSKGPVWSHVVLAAMAAKQLNRPVKLELRRPQMFGMLGFRSETRQAVTAGLAKDGTLTALSHETIAHTSSFDEYAETASMPARMLYQTPNNATDAQAREVGHGYAFIYAGSRRSSGDVWARGRHGRDGVPAQDGSGRVPAQELRRH